MDIRIKKLQLQAWYSEPEEGYLLMYGDHVRFGIDYNRHGLIVLLILGKFIYRSPGYKRESEALRKWGGSGGEVGEISALNI